MSGDGQAQKSLHELGTIFPQSQPLVKDCQFGVSPVNYSDSDANSSNCAGQRGGGGRNFSEYRFCNDKTLSDPPILGRFVLGRFGPILGWVVSA